MAGVDYQVVHFMDLNVWVAGKIVLSGKMRFFVYMSHTQAIDLEICMPIVNIYSNKSEICTVNLFMFSFIMLFY